MMLTALAVCAALFVGPALVSGQYRPSYFPRPGGFDKTLPQYAPQQTAQGGDAVLGNRNQHPDLPAPGAANSLDDKQLADRAKDWPRPNQPFWLINREHIQQHTAQQVPCQGAGCSPAVPVGPVHQSSFIGGR